MRPEGGRLQFTKIQWLVPPLFFVLRVSMLGHIDQSTHLFKLVENRET